MLCAVVTGKGLVAEVARELRFADGAAGPQEPGDPAGGPEDAETAGVARESGCGGDDMSLSGASDGRPLSDATRKVHCLGLKLGYRQENYACRVLVLVTEWRQRPAPAVRRHPQGAFLS